jgi:hypothetical protein
MKHEMLCLYKGRHSKGRHEMLVFIKERHEMLVFIMLVFIMLVFSFIKA